MADTHSGTPKMSRGMRILLLVSLAANLAVVGLVAGMLLLGPDHPHRRPPQGHDFVFPYTRAFSEDQRHELGRRLRGAFDEDRAERRSEQREGGYLDGYRAALGMLRADPFDAEAFRATLADQGAAARRRQEVGQQVFMDYVEAMSVDERRAYAERLEAEIGRMAERFNHARH